MPNYRYENKFIIDKYTKELLKLKLKGLMKLDSHSLNDEVSYYISSLYFDDLDYSAYYEKEDGVEYRKKYRIRMYNNDIKTLKLECKYKDENMTYKKECKLNEKNYRLLINNQLDKIKLKDDLYKDFLIDYKLKNLKPSVIVDYERLAYIYPYSDVRITFDSSIASSKSFDSFLNKDRITNKCVDDNHIVLEVKYNNILPEHIKMILNEYNLGLSAISKYTLSVDYQ